VHTCQDLVRALDKAGLGATAPAVVGGYFPNSTPQQLAAKANICSGAAPETHSHFFTSTGAFGSVDQHDQQVDDGHYRILINPNHTLAMGPSSLGDFHYTILNDTTLILYPIITAAERRRALANPDRFSSATWKVSVAYGGLPWKRVNCDTWC